MYAAPPKRSRCSISEPLAGANQQVATAPTVPVLVLGGRAPRWKRVRAHSASELQCSLCD